MELIWVVIIILYLVFTAVSSSKQKQRRAGTRDWEQDDPELTDVPSFEPERVQPRERSIPARPSVPEPRRAVPRTRPGLTKVAMVRREQKPAWVPDSRPEWRRAVILSEVLQPPRARRPYRLPLRRYN